MSEKGAEKIPQPPLVSGATPEENASIVGDGDEALDFLKAHGIEGNFAHDASRMKTLRRRIDRRVIPFLLLAYLMNYLDKILLNVSLARLTFAWRCV